MLLAVDIGNTNIVLGVYAGQKLRCQQRLETHPDLSVKAIQSVLLSLSLKAAGEGHQITSAVLASVVPNLTATWVAAIKHHIGSEPLLVSHLLKLPITIDVDEPEKLGADRIADAVAGFVEFGGPVIVVDFGTATTFEVLTAEGVYIGGVIVPGPKTAMADLAARAALLFEVSFERPSVVVGRTTSEQMKSGMFYGAVSQVDGIIDRIIDETGFAKCTVIATGGLATGIDQHSRHISRVIPTLTLDGLRLIWEANR